ncbi:hypothetical protein [Novipirellula artificiosorum]|uniref:Uncharacterized protein n=1 Tax=Novipirellula artificiosorum TaxID=2528016 RepID=A0A5C6DWZ1_9BACT|nr:hypothetical protein [Novipirellula artificiosorum]TWU40724.1 hypothetical protein Poly41_15590 [Novipirellula artificiosorum]
MTNRGYRNVAITDLVLVALSTIVLSLNLLPKPEPQQEVIVQHADGKVARYALPVSHPEVVRIRCGEAAMPSTEELIARWQEEVSRFYAQDHRVAALAEKDSNLVQVSYRTTPVKQRKSTRSSEPIFSLGQRIEPPHPLRNFVIAGAAGISLAVLFAVWSVLFPARKLLHRQAKSTANPSSDPVSSGVLAIELPPQWVSLHQGIAVRLRQLCTFALVIVSLVVAGMSFWGLS